ncbi:glutamate 5-kinase [Arenibacter algicola]|jgi:glutamate 5-kinase|uniref:Glutamate 5-kinase n=2 Tax=Arenibacter TaxID=178469 RepID=A0A221UW38_9FLAO|nr:MULTISPECIES: glutamate 5-kinase [Arenibacter]ASO05564.1 glutamate 5-kinase [Arenibacter algicola]MBD3660781.1 glutamate 5-kinase [Arenibacter algicola]RAJ11394.1 glutamate 5-kinase [Arenibacter echinorum]GBF21269.1 glutamate 5-kinase [Arenibacter sp. NBRC 103722]|tara:strand:+ start:21176 stop:21946 length:771 start_codon:yes stop_codon:yes gene_type:complete
MYKQRVVIKVGTNVMTNKDNRIVKPVLDHLVQQIAELYERNIMSVLVSSGSVIAGMEVMGESQITDKATRRQVYSAIGQPRMMRHYYNIFQDYGMKCAQVLATKRDFNPGSHRDNMINCYEGLLAEGVVPIANEDDAVSLTNSMFSDNDELASLVAELTKADKLIILTDTDGLFTGHPDDKDTEVIQNVSVDQNVEKYIKTIDKGEAEGRGGMGSKLNIAKQTASKNIPTYIANGKRKRVILDIVEGKSVGTKISV